MRSPLDRGEWLGCALVLALGGCGEDLGARSVGANAGQCASCHERQGQELERSRHARSATSEVFVALRERAEREHGRATFCDGCHRPEEGSGEGLTCVTCHAAIGNEGTHNGALVWELDGPVRGPTGHVDEAPHATSRSELLKSSDLCGTCHDAQGMPGFEERPYREWLSSPAAREGVTCSGCHFSPPSEPAGATSHRLAGFDDLSPQASDGAGAALAASALSMAVRANTAPGGGVRVEITHQGRGHPFPVGASFVREVWVSLELDADDGRPLFRSGDVGPDGSVRSDDGQVRWLSSRPVADDREVASPTEATDLRASPLATDAVTAFDFVTPNEPVTYARGCVRARRYRPELLLELGLSVDLAGEVVELGCASASLSP